MGQEDSGTAVPKILSGLDPLLDELDEAKRGDLYNTVSGQVYKGKAGVLYPVLTNGVSFSGHQEDQGAVPL